MNPSITNTIKNRFSESHFRKIGFDDAVDRFYYYDDYPIKRLPIEKSDRVTYTIKYYYCRQNTTRTVFEQKNLQIDMYTNKYQIVGYEKLKSEEQELFSSMISDDYLHGLLQNDANHELHIHDLKNKIGWNE